MCFRRELAGTECRKRGFGIFTGVRIRGNKSQVGILFASDFIVISRTYLGDL